MVLIDTFEESIFFKSFMVASVSVLMVVTAIMTGVYSGVNFDGETWPFVSLISLGLMFFSMFMKNQKTARRLRNVAIITIGLHYSIMQCSSECCSVALSLVAVGFMAYVALALFFRNASLICGFALVASDFLRGRFKVD